MKVYTLLLLFVGLLPIRGYTEIQVEERAVLAAEHSLYQGDLSLAVKLVQRHHVSVDTNSMPLQKLQILVWIEQEATDKAMERLDYLLKKHKDNADLHYFAAVSWETLTQQMSIFSRLGALTKTMKLYIRAGELAPNNAKYVRKQAMAYGQGKALGGDAEKQRPLLVKIQALDPINGYIAAMDLAQNERKLDYGVKLAQQAVSEHPSSFLLTERAAQMHWTNDDLSSAQALFLQACQLPTPDGEDRLIWIYACYSVVYVTQKLEENFDKGLLAMQRLLSVNQLATKKNDEARLYLAEMAMAAQQAELAKQTYAYLANHALDKKIKRTAAKRRKRLP